MNATDKERLEVLAGARGKAALPGAAVRRRDLLPLLSLPVPAAGKVPAGSTVMAEPFNALVDDVAALRQAILQVVRRLNQ